MVSITANIIKVEIDRLRKAYHDEKEQYIISTTPWLFKFNRHKLFNAFRYDDKYKYMSNYEIALHPDSYYNYIRLSHHKVI